MNILVTGISKGVGLQTAKTLLAKGHCVYGISKSKTEGLSALLSEYPDRLQWKSFDLNRVESIPEELFKSWIGFDTPLHGLVNNAAVAYDDITTNLRLQPLEQMFTVNVYAPFMLTKYAIRHMLLHHIAGSIVHLSSISVHTGYKGLSMYAATKGALEAFSKNVAREFGERGIRSNCIVAGFMDTDMSASLNEDQKKRIYRRTALKKAVRIESVAETIAFLLSEQSDSITGQNIFVDAGTI